MANWMDCENACSVNCKGVAADGVDGAEEMADWVGCENAGGINCGDVAAVGSDGDGVDYMTLSGGEVAAVGGDGVVSSYDIAIREIEYCFVASVPQGGHIVCSGSSLVCV